MPLNRTYADVLLDHPTTPGDTIRERVEVRSADMLHAEQAGTMRGIDLSSQVHVGHLWAWSAMRREQKLPEGLTEFEPFVRAAIAISIDQDEVDVIPPTQPEASAASASSSPSTPDSPTTSG